MIEKLLTILLVFSVLTSCNNIKKKEQKTGNRNINTINSKTKENNKHKKKGIEKQIDIFARNLNGLWLSNEFLVNIKKYNSIYKARQNNRENSRLLFGFSIDSNNLTSKNPNLFGFTFHEGGLKIAIKYDKKEKTFVSDTTRTSALTKKFIVEKYSPNILGLNFLSQNKQTQKYKKVQSIQSGIREALIVGKYKSLNSSKVTTFFENGMVENFKNYRYYELFYDFSMGIEYDTINFFKTNKGGNLGDGTIYKYEINNDKLYLQLIKPNWQTMKHTISNDTLTFVKE